MTQICRCPPRPPAPSAIKELFKNNFIAEGAAVAEICIQSSSLHEQAFFDNSLETLRCTPNAKRSPKRPRTELVHSLRRTDILLGTPQA